jgi:hypothetical protein
MGKCSKLRIEDLALLLQGSQGLHCSLHFGTSATGRTATTLSAQRSGKVGTAGTVQCLHCAQGATGFALRWGV